MSSRRSCVRSFGTTVRRLARCANTWSAIVLLAACSGSRQRPVESVHASAVDAGAHDASVDAASPDGTPPDVSDASNGTNDERAQLESCPNGERPANPPPADVESPAREAFANLMDRLRSGGEAEADRFVDRAFAARFFRANRLFSPSEPAIHGAPPPMSSPTGFGRALQTIARACSPRWTSAEGRLDIQPGLEGAPAVNLRELDAVNRRVQASHGATVYCGGCALLEARYEIDRAGVLHILGWGELGTPPAIAPNH